MVEVASTSAPAAAKLKPRKVSARRSWPKGCGRFPAVPVPLADPSLAADADPPPLDPPPLAATAAATDHFVSSSCNGFVSPEKVVENGGASSAVPVDPQTAKSLDSLKANGVVKPVSHGDAGAAKKGSIVPSGVLENGADTSALVAEKEAEAKFVALEGEDGAGMRKRWLESALHPPPKMRKVSAVRRFPAGCGRTNPLVHGTGSGASEEKKIANGERKLETDVGVAASASKKASVEGVSDEELKGKNLQDEAMNEIHRLPASNVKDGKARGTPAGARQPIVAEASAKCVSDDKMKGKGWGGDEKNVARQLVKSEVAAGVAEDDKARSKCEDVLQQAVVEALVRDASDEKMKGRRLESNKMNKMLLEVPGEVVEDDKLGSKTSRMERLSLVKNQKAFKLSGKAISSEKIAQKVKQEKEMDKSAKDALRRSPEEEETESASHEFTYDMEEDASLDKYTGRIVVQALMSRDKCPWMQGRESIAGLPDSILQRKKLKKGGKVGKKMLPKKAVSSSKLIGKERLDDEGHSKLDDNENSKALVLYEGKRELCVNLTPCVPSEWRQKESGDHHADARSKVRRLLKLFQLVSRKLLQGEEAKHSTKIRRIDLDASNIIKKFPDFEKPGALIGHVPGVEVGDEFHYRVELSLIGLHRPYQGGIDWTKENGVLLATSIVASGGYPDELSSSDVLTYSGAGGKPVGKKEPEDQKLERGNLALKNSIEARTPVRVIHGFKGRNRDESGDSRAKQVSTFAYDGLYMVEACWQKPGPHGANVFQFRLRRIPGQPELALHIVKQTKKSKVREGLCMSDISQGREKIPICVINTVDGERPAAFKYITKIIYPHWYKKDPPQGCDCKDGCSDSTKCACAVKNGGEIPFNFNGAIVQAKPLIYECGPSCRCPPKCHNRVSQHGIKIPLEIFKTEKRGWGVRSLNSIPSGSFICEYAGELLQDTEAEQRSNDEYLFDIGHNYDDQDLWEGLPSIIPGMQSSSCCQTVEEKGFTIDAAGRGNVGRFINHSCSPNLYAQNVLYDHDDKRMPHIMFFAAENIPPLQELTYHYNYTIDQVRDSDGNIKSKRCYCGSPECSGRLY